MMGNLSTERSCRNCVCYGII